MNEFTLGKILEITKKRKPDFNNILDVLSLKKPGRYTLFEFFLNDPLYAHITGRDRFPVNDEVERSKCIIESYAALGYDYVTMHASNFGFHHTDNEHHKSSLSINEGSIIQDWDTYNAYVWDEPEDFDNKRFERVKHLLPEGMKFIVYGPGGVLENVTSIVGYDNICYMLYDSPELVEIIFDHVGERLVRYYQSVIDLDCIGAMISNDDWGFNTQTMLPTDAMRKYVFKWHKKITDVARSAGKPVILHSCGNLESVYDDIIYDMGYNGKHSYEDNILPVEQAYDVLSDKIAVLGGIDLDFVCRSTPEEVYKRSRAMVEKTGCKSYALGTGNSVPDYVPYENYFAMISAALTD